MEIKLSGISKKYLYKTALDSVDLDFKGGMIHALLGENGAGKSTLASILSGSLQASEGTIFVDSQEVHFFSEKDAIKKGIIIVNQRPQLSEDLNGLENILLQHSFFSPKKIPPNLLSLQKEWTPKLNLKTKVKNLSGNNRFYISLLCALMQNPRCLILDEPSAFLDQNERENLYLALKNFVSSFGRMGIIITHSTAESLKANTITLLKKGKLDAVFTSSESYKKFAKEKISSAKINGITPFLSDCKNAKPAVCFKNICAKSKTKPAVLNADFCCYYGTICAINGTNEPSLTTFEDFVTGMYQGESKGNVTFFCNEKKFSFSAEQFTKRGNEILYKLNVAIVPSDRSFRASNPNLTVSQMLCAHKKSGVKNQANSLIKKANVNIEAQEKCSHLSGGMLQRLILERELSKNPSIIILCNPMQALDIEAQGLLTKRICELSKEGKSVLILGAEDVPLSICTEVYELDGGILRKSFSAFDLEKK